MATAEPLAELERQIKENLGTLLTTGQLSFNINPQLDPTFAAPIDFDDPSVNPDVGYSVTDDDDLERSRSPASAEGVEQPSPPYDAVALRSRGSPLTPDGGVVKVPVAPGLGDANDFPKSGTRVWVRYRVYLDLATEPFDAAFWRKPAEVCLGDDDCCDVLEGIDIGIRSLKPQEEALLVIQPDYAYLSAGSFPVVPPDATIIVHIRRVEIDRGILAVVPISVNPSADSTPKANAESSGQKLKQLVRLAKKCRAMVEEDPLHASRALAMLRRAESVLWDPLEKDKERQLWDSIAGKVLLTGAFLADSAGSPAIACEYCSKIDDLPDIPLPLKAKLYLTWGKALYQLASPGDEKACEKALKKLKKAALYAEGAECDDIKTRVERFLARVRLLKEARS